MAGAESGPADGARELAAPARRPGGGAGGEGSRARSARRAARGSACPATRASPSGDRLGQAEPRRPPSRRRATSRSASPNAGKAYPAPSGTVARIRFVGAASPTTRGSSPPTASTPTSRPSRSGSPRSSGPPARAGRRQPRGQRVSGKVVPRGRHGRLGLLRRERRRRQHRRDGEVPERRRARLAVDRRPTPSCASSTPPPAPTALGRRPADADGDGWPEGAGNVEREGMGAGEARQRRLHDPRPLGPRRPAPSQGGRRHGALGARRGRPAPGALRGGVVDAGRSRATPTRSSTPATTVYQRYWIGATRWRPRSSAAADRRAASPTPATPAATLDAARDLLLRHRLRPLPHGDAGLRPVGGGQEREADLHAQHGGDGRGGGQLRAPRPSSGASPPPTGGCSCPTPTSSPGRCPRSRRRSYYGRSVDKSFLERASVLQAWGSYGTAWPVVHQQLGVRPDLGNGRLDVVPQQPTRAPIAGSAIRLGSGSLDVRAWRSGAATSPTSTPASGATSGCASAGSCRRARGSAASRSTAGASCRSCRPRRAGSRCSSAPARPAVTGSWCGRGRRPAPGPG